MFEAAAAHPTTVGAERAAAPVSVAVDQVRLRAVVSAHHGFVWRSLRRLGVREADVDDAAQKVFMTLSRKLVDVSVGGEKAFLFAIATRIAANERRSAMRKREAPIEDMGVDGPADDSMHRELERRDARAMLDMALDSLTPELREVFVLFELEELTGAEVAEVVGIPSGTVASRLRRAREEVTLVLKRLQSSSGEGAP